MTVLFSALFVVSPSILFIATYWFALDYAAEDYREEIAAEFQIMMDEAGPAGYAKLPQVIANHIREHANRPTAYLLEDSSGNKLAGNIAARSPGVGSVKVEVSTDRGMEDLEAMFFKLPNDQYLLIGETSEKLEEFKTHIISTFVIGGSVTLLIGALCGLLASSTLLRRLGAITGVATGIASGNLSTRVPATGRGDEFDKLADSINAMLERIEDLMLGLRQVSSDIAHDLRMPLSRLKQGIESTRYQDCSPAELHEALDHASQQVDVILETFGSLLKIAQMEAGQIAANAESFSLSDLLLTLVDDFMPAAEDRGQHLVALVDPGIEIAGEPRLLVQLATNLVENAIHHTPPGTTISVAARRTPAGVIIEVADTGPGIPQSEHKHVVRPFYRLQRSRVAAGNGLGLSLVMAIAKYHGATLSFRDNDPGLIVSVVFPTDRP